MNMTIPTAPTTGISPGAFTPSPAPSTPYGPNAIFSDPSMWKFLEGLDPEELSKELGSLSKMAGGFAKMQGGAGESRVAQMFQQQQLNQQQKKTTMPEYHLDPAMAGELLKSMGLG